MQAPSSKAERFNCRDESGKINIPDLFEKYLKQKYKTQRFQISTHCHDELL